MGKIGINSCLLKPNNGNRVIGKGLYLDFSILDHSCAPNAVWYSKGKELVVRTIENVDDFSQLRISYLPNLFEKTESRREKLMQDYFFLCQCSRCQDQSSDLMKSSLNCSKCKQGIGVISTMDCTLYNDCRHLAAKSSTKPDIFWS